MYFHQFPKGSTPVMESYVKSLNKMAETQRVVDYQNVLSTDSGRRVLCDILGMTGMWHETDTTARSMGLKLMHYLWDNLGEEYLIMHNEMVKSERAFAMQMSKMRKGAPNADTRGTASREGSAGESQGREGSRREGSSREAGGGKEGRGR